MRTSKSSTPSKHWQMLLRLWRQRKSSLVHMKKCETVWNTCSSLILSTLNRFKRFNEFVILSYLTCVYIYIYTVYIYIYTHYMFDIAITWSFTWWFRNCSLILSAWHHPWAPPPAPDPKISKITGEIIQKSSRLQFYPLVMSNTLLLKMAMEIVELPIKHGDFP